jgi:hypothetical protein
MYVTSTASELRESSAFSKYFIPLSYSIPVKPKGKSYTLSIIRCLPMEALNRHHHYSNPPMEA